MTPAPPALNRFNAVQSLLPDAILVGIVGFVEQIVIAKTYAIKHNYQISPNRELVALGFSNIIGSFFHTFPTFGGISRSAVSDALGATSQFFSLVSSLIILLTMLFLGPLFYHLPKSTMAAIITSAATRLFEIEDAKFMYKIKAWKELAQFFVTFALSIVIGLELGIFISIGISVFFIIKHTTYPHISILGNIPGTTKYKDVTQYETNVYPGILIVKIEDPLYFANISQVKTLLLRIERLGDIKAHPADQENPQSLHTIIIHASNIPSMDASAIQLIEELVHDYKLREINVVWVKLRDSIKKPFILSGIMSSNEDNQLFSTTHEAVLFFHNQKSHKHIQPLVEDFESEQWNTIQNTIQNTLKIQSENKDEQSESDYDENTSSRLSKF